MSIERGAEYYDKYYSDEALSYYKHYSASEYYEMWKKVLALIPNVKIDIFEIGCGPGQFAQMLCEERKEIFYTGIDFSEVAIKEAKRINPALYTQLFCKDAYTAKIKNDCMVVSLETFEHLNDFKIIDQIPLGVELIFTIPDFDQPSHVRYFKNIAEIVFRYHQKINFTHIEKFQRWFICKGVTI